MIWTRPAFRGLAWLFVLCVLIEFFLAGLGMADLGGKGSALDTHATFGQTALTLIPVAMLVIGFVGKMGRTIIGGTLALLVLVILQSLWVQLDASWLKAIHPVAALVIFGLAHFLAQHARPPAAAS